MIEKQFRWQKMKRHEITGVEALLQSREPFCVTACSRFINRQTKDKIWTLRNSEGRIIALIIYSRQSLLPVFCSQQFITAPHLMLKSIRTLPVHAIQGLQSEVLILEQFLQQFGLDPAEIIDYDLMLIDGLPDQNNLSAGPADLVLRSPRYTDMNALASLQAGYEQEEVLPKGAVFNPAASRYNMEKIFSDEQILIAQLNGRLVGKINTSAASFSCFQIGGVYVHPEFLNMGIARRMTAEFVSSLVSQGKKVSLFVKKSNPAALSVYRHCGFEYLEDYRISYYF